MKKIGFVGCGNIATAILGGILSSEKAISGDIYCYDTDEKKSAVFNEKGVNVCSSVGELAGTVNILFLTVKPQVFPLIYKEIESGMNTGTVIVSPMAGIKISSIEQKIPSCCIIRVMPNTPLLYSAGATAIARGENVSDDDFNFVFNIFSGCGIAEKVPEKLMDIVTGISGSSPAFFMRMAEQFALAGEKEGMDYNTAKQLVVQTMLGTAKMVLKSQKDISELIKNVASPGGTTEAGLKTMDQTNFDDIAYKTVKSAIDRSAELSK